MNKKFYPGVYFIFIFAVVMFCAGEATAQSSKTKPAPKPTPKATTKPKMANTPAPTSGILGELETRILAEISELRADPSGYAKHLEHIKSDFNGKNLKLSDGTQLVTNEGVAAVSDAITFLRAAPVQGAFKLSPGLTKAARDHLQDMIKKELSGHKGSNGSLPPQRVERYGQWSLGVKENISYMAQTPRDIVINMLIDDGNAKREHRRNLLSRDLRVIGLAAGDGKTYGRLCVVVFAGEFSEKK